MIISKYRIKVDTSSVAVRESADTVDISSSESRADVAETEGPSRAKRVVCAPVWTNDYRMG